MLLKKHQRESIKRMFSVLMCFVVLFWTYSSNLSIFANAEGNAVGLNFDQTTVTEGAEFQANLTATPENSEEQYTFSVPEGLSISGVTSGGENIEKVSEGKQALTFTWNGNGNQAVVKLLAEKAGNYAGQLSSASGSAQASVTVITAEVEEPEQTEPEQSESNEASTPESSEESSDEDPAPETEADEEQQPAANESESAASTEQEPAAIADDSVTEEESLKGNQTRASGTYDHVDIQVAVDATVMIDGKEVKISINTLDPKRLTVIGAESGELSYVGITSTYDSNTKAWELRKMQRNPGFDKNETFTVSYTFNSDEITGLAEGETITYTGEYSYYVNNSCGADESHGRGLDIHITAERLTDFFTNGTLVIDKSIEGGTPTKEAKFTFNVISVKDGTSYGPYYVTGANFVTITDLPAGSYIVEEVNLPDGYTVNGASQQVVVKTDGKVERVNFKNYYKDNTASLTIKKTVEGINEDGAFSFLVTGPNGYSETVEIKTVNGENSYTINGLAPGEYNVKELDPSNPSAAFQEYQLTGVTAGGKEITASKDESYSSAITLVNGKNEIQFVNKYADKGSLTIKKVDADNNNAPLADATFTLYKKGTDEQVGTPQTTNSEGKATFGNLAWGEYDIKETGVPAGYQKVVDSSVTIGKGNIDAEVTIKNSRIKGSITVHKVDATSKEPLAGAEFTLYKKDTDIKVGEAKTTDKDGNVTFEGLEWGDYDIKETKAPEGYNIVTEKTSVTIDGTHTTVPVQFTDTRILGTVTVVKVDKESGQALKGAKFAIFDENNKQVGDTQTTGDDGTATFLGLKWAKYHVKEVEPPTGYEKIEGAIEVVIDAHHTAIQQLKVENTRTAGTLTVVKIDEKTGDELKGAVFTLYKAGTNQQVGEPQTTNEKGEAVFTDLEWGTYDLKETSAPKGYEKAEGVVKTVTIGQQDTKVDVEIKNTRTLGTITVTKVNADNKDEKLEGAVFTLLDKNGKQIGKPQTTDENGVATFENLAWGEYEVKETEAPVGYNLVTESAKVTIEQTQTSVPLVFTNTRVLGTLTVTKLDADNKDAKLEGAVFRLLDSTGKQVGEPQKTNEKGEAVFTGLEWGEYNLEEVQAPDGYEKAEGTVKTVTIAQKETAVSVEIENARILGTITIEKTDPKSEEFLEGAIFTLYKEGTDEQVGKPQTTGKDGKAIFKDLAWGEYELKETQAPVGYEKITESKKVTIDQEKQTYNFEIENERVPGKITVHKVDAETKQALEGAKFTLYNKATGEQVGETLTTDKDGNVTFDNLPWGNYEVKETEAPQGYNIVTESASATIDRTHLDVPLTFTDTRILGTLTVAKVDAENETLLLEGAEFTLYKKETNEQVGKPQTTGADGIAIFKQLPWDEYYVKETKAPEGYVLSDSAEPVTISQDTTAVKVSVKNTRVLGTVTVEKVDADNEGAPLEGAVFTLFKAGTNEQVGKPQTTGKDGKATFTGLAWGSYDVKETSAPAGYEKSKETKTVTIEQNTINTGVEFKNTRILGTLTVTKVDADSKAKLKGAGFTLYEKDGDQVGEEKFTNAEGVVKFENLAWGEYEVKETTAPQGYTGVNEAQPVTIGQNDIEVGIDIKNARILGTITVEKLDADNENAPLSGAEFTLYKAGTNEQVGVPQTTGADGTATFENLVWGSYDVKETNAPTGYNKVDEIRTVTIGQSKVEVNVEVKNTRILGTLTVTKVDKESKDVLQDAVFTLYNEKGEQVGKPQATGEEGTVTFTNLPWGKYEVEETEAPTGYEQLKERKPVTIGQETTKVDLEIENTRTLGTITVKKIDAESQEALQGAVFTLYDQAGNQVGQPQTTKETGEAKFTDLAWGEYEVKETQAPLGYQEAKGSHKVTVQQMETKVNVVIKNTRIPGEVKVLKVDADNDDAPLAGAEFTLYNEKGEQVGKPQVTKADGTVVFTDLAWGKYEVKETKAPEGYNLVEDSAIVTVGQAQTSFELTFTNKRILGTVTVAKVDAENEAVLQGAEFTLYNEEGEQVGEPQVTKEDGIAEFKGLAWGKYEVKETKAPQGYQLDAEAKPVTIGQKETAVSITVENSRILGALTVTKVDADNENAPLAGAEFTLYKDGKPVGEPQVTGEDGTVTFDNLAWGEYELAETDAPEGYQLVTEKEVIVFGAEKTDHQVTIANVKIKADLIVEKKDAETGEDLAGAVFILTQDGEFIGEVTTDETGKAVFEKLVYGDYQLTEYAAPAGYLLPEENQWTVSIKDTEDVKLNIENTAEHPSLLVEKTADKEQYLPGETIHYTINVTNDGNMPLEGITLTDVFSKNGEAAVDGQLAIEGYEGPFNLEVNETATFTSSYVVPETDLADTTYTNTVEATARDIVWDAEVTVVVDPTYALTVDKTADKEQAEVGDTVTYTINVTNTGNKALENVKVVDEMVNLNETVERLDVNETVTFTEEYTVTSADVGELENIAVATAMADDEAISAEGDVIITVAEEVIPPAADEPTQLKDTVNKVYQWITNPKTGEEATNILLIAAAFLLAGLGLYFYKRKAKH